MPTKIGRPSQCGSCGTCERCRRAAYMREWWRRLPVERKRTMIAARDPQVSREQDRRKQARRRIHGTPEQKLKIAARMEVTHALEAGHLKRLPCEVCGATHAQAHHDDYNRPLDIRWLCRQHHAELHGQPV